jgi:hypothetical protein
VRLAGGLWIPRLRRPDGGRWEVGLAVLVLLPALVLANLDVGGYTKPMELLLFQPSSWSYLWSH